MKVLLVDIGAYVSLAITRSLGKAGHHVDGTGCFDTRQPVERSRFFGRLWQTPPPSQAAPHAAALVEIVREGAYDCVLPCTEPGLRAVFEAESDLRRLTRYLLPDANAIRITLSKAAQALHAQSLGLNVPRTIVPTCRADVERLAATWPAFPAVIKGKFGGHMERVRYARDGDDLVRRYEEMLAIHPPRETDDWPLLQEYIDGSGIGYFGLYEAGKERACFMHRRVWEYPVTGGPSSIAQSIWDEELRNTGRRVLEALNWTGLAMVEFKRERHTGRLVYMEINPRPWGSMALPISLGIDFPLWYVQLACEGRTVFPTRYPTERLFIWAFPNCALNVLAEPWKIGYLIAAIMRYGAKWDVEFSDLAPLLGQIRETLYYVKKISLQDRKRLRYPQGKAGHHTSSIGL